MDDRAQRRLFEMVEEMQRDITDTKNLIRTATDLKDPIMAAQEITELQSRLVAHQQAETTSRRIFQEKISDLTADLEKIKETEEEAWQRYRALEWELDMERNAKAMLEARYAKLEAENDEMRRELMAGSMSLSEADGGELALVTDGGELAVTHESGGMALVKHEVPKDVVARWDRQELVELGGWVGVCVIVFVSLCEALL